MHLSKVNEALDHKIVGGSEFGWQCWPNARYIDYESEYAHASVIFNIETQEIYCAEVNDKADEHKPYRWMHPDHKRYYEAEAKMRKVDPMEAWDGIKWYELETPEDWCEKAHAIFNGESFDTRVQVPLNFEKEELYRLMEMAHERDVTLNKMVEIVLQAAIDHSKEV